MNKHLVNTVLKAVAAAMGIAVIVTSVLGVLTSQTADMLLGIGLFALSITAMQK